MTRSFKMIPLFAVALVAFCVAAVTSHRWIGGEKNDLGLGLIVGLSFMSLYFLLTLGLVITTVVAAQSLDARPKRLPREVVLVMIGIVLSAAAIGYAVFFFTA